MAKAVGLDPGEFEVKLVELDGSYRRPRLTRVAVEPVASLGSREAFATNMADAALLAFDEASIGKDGFGMAFPCREAVLRHLNVPFIGRENIRKVIKFEAEGSIHSHNVDDMVVDFATLEEIENETHVLVAAVPKPSLRNTMQALQRNGIEPETVDLDTMALFTAAEWCGAFNGGETPEATGEDGDALAPIPTSKPARLVLDLGARSTRVLVVVDGKLTDMRTLRTGADSMADEVGALMGVGLAQAREAVEESLRTDEDFVVVGGEDLFAEEEEAEETGDEAAQPAEAGAEVADDEARTHLVPHSEVSAARDRFLARLRRELIRFMTAVPTAANVEAVFVTGGASQTPGSIDVIREVFGQEPKGLDLLANLNHKLDSDEIRALGPKLAVAVGLALNTLGGRASFNFRQEELAFTKGFDRVKFPLAIACMLLLFLALMFGMRSWRELRLLGETYGATHSVTEEQRARGKVERKAIFWGHLGAMVNENTWFERNQDFDRRAYNQLVDKLLATETFKRLPVVRRELDDYYRNQQKESGYYADLRIGSGLGALVEFAALLSANEEQLGRYLVEKIDLKLPFKADSRRLTATIVLRSDAQSNFRVKWQHLQDALRATCESADSVFDELRDSKEVQLFDEGGDSGCRYSVTLGVRADREYPIFPRATS